jgi:hypothetical protein
MNQCKLVKASSDGSWDILRCPGTHGTYYVVRAFEEKMVPEAFAVAKREGLIDELTTIYVMECGEWVGAVGIYQVALNVAVTDYSRKECVSSFMEIVKAVIRRLSENESEEMYRVERV